MNSYGLYSRIGIKKIRLTNLLVLGIINVDGSTHGKRGLWTGEARYDAGRDTAARLAAS
jgi:hypothetical protein